LQSDCRRESTPCPFSTRLLFAATQELSEDAAAFEAADIELCGGVISGSPGSFRGKVYDRLVFAITGVSLYQEWIPPDRVEQMCEALLHCDPADYADCNDPRFGDPQSTVENLRRFFRVCVQRGLGIVGWW
jgi:hypothetical protein